jgi:hypothetical protein
MHKKLEPENLSEIKPLEYVGSEERTTLITPVLKRIIFNNSFSTLQNTY